MNQNEIQGNFTMIPNALLLDNALTDRARFLYILIKSKPPEWKFFHKALSKETGYSTKTLLKYIHELEERGWIEVVKRPFQGNEYKIHTTPIFPHKKKLPHEKSSTRKNDGTYKYLSLINTKENKNKSSSSDETAEISKIDRAYRLYFNKPLDNGSRMLLEKLCDEYSEEEIIKAMQTAKMNLDNKINLGYIKGILQNQKNGFTNERPAKHFTNRSGNSRDNQFSYGFDPARFEDENFTSNFPDRGN